MARCSARTNIMETAEDITGRAAEIMVVMAVMAQAAKKQLFKPRSVGFNMNPIGR